MPTPGRVCSGAAFELDDPPDAAVAVQIDGWTVTAPGGSGLVVATGGDDRGYEAAYQSGLDHAQKALDLLSVKGAANLSIRHITDEHLTWWPTPDGLVIRIVSFAPLRIHVNTPTVVVTRSDGSPQPQAPAPTLAWHQSFRYFRLSQTTDDLFDAYRNAYLALESLLSSIAPQKIKPTGRPGEKEGEWFTRALTAAGRLVSLSQFVPAGTSDPVAFLFEDLYLRRSAMSHAKGGRGTLLPREEADRVVVAQSLQRLVKLYLGVAEAQLGARRAGGGLFAVAFGRMYEPALNALEVFASDDETALAPDDSSVNPGGGQLVPVPAVSAADASLPFLTTRLFSASAHDLTRLPFIRRIVGRNQAGQPAMAEVLKGRLDVGLAARLEVLLGIRGENSNQPRQRYVY